MPEIEVSLHGVEGGNSQILMVFCPYEKAHHSVENCRPTCCSGLLKRIDERPAINKPCIKPRIWCGVTKEGG